jgi:hypothetical protein
MRKGQCESIVKKDTWAYKNNIPLQARRILAVLPFMV